MKMFRRSAPSARRTPISRVRCSTACAITPYSPIAASSSASPANSPSRSALRRVRHVASPNRVPIVLALATGRSRSSACTSRRTAGMSAAASSARPHEDDSVGARRLQQRNIRVGGSGLLDRAVAYVPDDADHLGAILKATLSECDLLSDRILSAKERARGRLVDHGDFGLALTIALGKRPAAHELDTHRLEEFRRRPVDAGTRFATWRDWRLVGKRRPCGSCSHRTPARTGRRRRIARLAAPAHARAAPWKNCVERASSYCVTRQRQRETSSRPSGFEAERRVLQVLHALQHQARRRRAAPAQARFRRR